MNTRRHFLKLSSTISIAAALRPTTIFATEVAPTFNPTSSYGLNWTDKLAWGRVVDISVEPGAGPYWDERLAHAQARLAARGGGVVWFPAGRYAFRDDIKLKSGVILRGATPNGATSAHQASYEPPTYIEFPKYQPIFAGEGAPTSTAFKGIHLEDPAVALHVGVVFLNINYGHIHFAEGEGHQAGRNRIVYGCVLRNSAIADPGVPDVEKLGQHPWQRFTARHHAAVDVKASENILIANNRLPKSGKANFTMKDFKLKPARGSASEFDVVFDYDNRPGLYVNHFCVGGAGGSGNDGTPNTHPHGFRKGIVIRDNYIFNTGRMGIGFCGDGVICSNNIIRFEDNVYRPTVTGLSATHGSSTNDNRAIEMRGWRWVVERNDYQVYRNICSDGSYRINDGEGLMHEDHCNSTIIDSRLVGNRGNSYLSLYKCGLIDGLLVEGNDISTPGKIDDIYVVADRNSGREPCRNVSILDNITRSNGIRIGGSPASGNVVRGNHHLGGSVGRIVNEASARLDGNVGYGG